MPSNCSFSLMIAVDLGADRRLFETRAITLDLAPRVQ